MDQRCVTVLLILVAIAIPFGASNDLTTNMTTSSDDQLPLFPPILFDYHENGTRKCYSTEDTIRECIHHDECGINSGTVNTTLSCLNLDFICCEFQETEGIGKRQFRSYGEPQYGGHGNRYGVSNKGYDDHGYHGPIPGYEGPVVDLSGLPKGITGYNEKGSPYSDVDKAVNYGMEYLGQRDTLEKELLNKGLYVKPGTSEALYSEYMNSDDKALQAERRSFVIFQAIKYLAYKAGDESKTYAPVKKSTEYDSSVKYGGENKQGSENYGENTYGGGNYGENKYGAENYGENQYSGGAKYDGEEPYVTGTYSKALYDSVETGGHGKEYPDDYSRECKATKYRTIDGHCNNLKNPDFGRAFKVYNRLLPANYADDVSAPRRAKDKSYLPNVRLLSTTICTDHSYPVYQNSLMVMQWGQFIDHDMSFSSVYKARGSAGILCCAKEIQYNRHLLHPECLPIIIPKNDYFYSQKGSGCMEFVRSLAGTSDDKRYNSGKRQQLNQQTSFLDGSVIYGTTVEESNSLRTYKYGTLVTVNKRGFDYLPVQSNPQCTDPSLCFRVVAGDTRANMHPWLTVLHIVMVRQHNDIAYRLHEINPDWDDEYLYQESRRIIGAIMQHITYNELLPSFLGYDVLEKYGLIPKKYGYSNDYNDYLNPTTLNEFSAAAFRVGHSLINGLIEYRSREYGNGKLGPLRDHFFDPLEMFDEGEMDKYILSLMTQLQDRADTHVTREVTNYLFKTKNTTHGMDLISLNLQRGRDHGIPSYNDYRKLCGYKQAYSFEELYPSIDRDVITKMKYLYKTVDDIDLFIGGIAEKHNRQSLIGPTFACIISNQFRRVKKGDRHWYELGGQPSSFTPEQLKEIRKVTLARVICDNSDKIKYVQRWVFKSPVDGNPQVDCSYNDIARIDLTKWKASYQTGYGGSSYSQPKTTYVEGGSNYDSGYKGDSKDYGKGDSEVYQSGYDEGSNSYDSKSSGDYNAGGNEMSESYGGEIGSHAYGGGETVGGASYDTGYSEGSSYGESSIGNIGKIDILDKLTATGESGYESSSGAEDKSDSYGEGYESGYAETAHGGGENYEHGNVHHSGSVGGSAYDSAYESDDTHSKNDNYGAEKSHGVETSYGASSGGAEYDSAYESGDSYSKNDNYGGGMSHGGEAHHGASIGGSAYDSVHDGGDSHVTHVDISDSDKYDVGLGELGIHTEMDSGHSGYGDAAERESAAASKSEYNTDSSASSDHDASKSSSYDSEIKSYDSESDKSASSKDSYSSSGAASEYDESDSEDKLAIYGKRTYGAKKKYYESRYGANKAYEEAVYSSETYSKSHAASDSSESDSSADQKSDSYDSSAYSASSKADDYDKKTDSSYSDKEHDDYSKSDHKDSYDKSSEVQKESKPVYTPPAPTYDTGYGDSNYGSPRYETRIYGNDYDQRYPRSHDQKNDTETNDDDNLEDPIRNERHSDGEDVTVTGSSENLEEQVDRPERAYGEPSYSASAYDSLSSSNSDDKSSSSSDKDSSSYADSEVRSYDKESDRYDSKKDDYSASAYAKKHSEADYYDKDLAYRDRKYGANKKYYESRYGASKGYEDSVYSSDKYSKAHAASDRKEYDTAEDRKSDSYDSSSSSARSKADDYDRKTDTSYSDKEHDDYYKSDSDSSSKSSAAVEKESTPTYTAPAYDSTYERPNYGDSNYGQPKYVDRYEQRYPRSHSTANETEIDEEQLEDTLEEPIETHRHSDDDKTTVEGITDETMPGVDNIEDMEVNVDRHERAYGEPSYSASASDSKASYDSADKSSSAGDKSKYSHADSDVRSYDSESDKYDSKSDAYSAAAYDKKHSEAENYDKDAAYGEKTYGAKKKYYESRYGANKGYEDSVYSSDTYSKAHAASDRKEYDAAADRKSSSYDSSDSSARSKADDYDRKTDSSYSDKEHDDYYKSDRDNSYKSSAAAQKESRPTYDSYNRYPRSDENSTQTDINQDLEMVIPIVNLDHINHHDEAEVTSYTGSELEDNPERPERSYGYTEPSRSSSAYDSSANYGSSDKSSSSSDRDKSSYDSSDRTSYDKESDNYDSKSDAHSAAAYAKSRTDSDHYDKDVAYSDKKYEASKKYYESNYGAKKGYEDSVHSSDKYSTGKAKSDHKEYDSAANRKSASHDESAYSASSKADDYDRKTDSSYANSEHDDSYNSNKNSNYNSKEAVQKESTPTYTPPKYNRYPREHVGSETTDGIVNEGILDEPLNKEIHLDRKINSDIIEKVDSLLSMTDSTLEVNPERPERSYGYNGPSRSSSAYDSASSYDSADRSSSNSDKDRSSYDSSDVKSYDKESDKYDSKSDDYSASQYAKSHSDSDYYDKDTAYSDKKYEANKKYYESRYGAKKGYADGVYSSDKYSKKHAASDRKEYDAAADRKSASSAASSYGSKSKADDYDRKTDSSYSNREHDDSYRASSADAYKKKVAVEKESKPTYNPPPPVRYTSRPVYRQPPPRYQSRPRGYQGSRPAYVQRPTYSG